MNFRSFYATDEEKIKKFLQENRDLIGKDSYWVEPKSGRICFLFNDKFDPKFAENINKRVKWQQFHAEACDNIAQIEYDLEELYRRKPDEIVTQEQRGAQIMGKNLPVGVSTKEMLKRHQAALDYWQNKKADCEKLLEQ